MTLTTTAMTVTTVDGAPAGRARPADFRALMSEFPSGVAVVTTLEPDGTPRGTTCTALTAVTAEPPTLLVCLDNASATLAAVRTIGCFAVNLLHDGGRGAAETFAARVPDRFARATWRPGPLLGLPRLVDDALASAECLVSGMHVVGDHTIVLGRVCDVAPASGTPLLYGRRRFSRWTGAGGPGAAAS
jgi:flavin reductase (DIM6/NTAB) family NADH-FMN oxidoreductase RutF